MTADGRYGTFMGDPIEELVMCAERQGYLITTRNNKAFVSDQWLVTADNWNDMTNHSITAYPVESPAQKIRCNYCGRKNDVEVELCKSCGAPL